MMLYLHTTGLTKYNNTVAATDVIASSCAGLTPLLRRIGYVVSYTTAGADTGPDSAVKGLPGAEPAMGQCL